MESRQGTYKSDDYAPVVETESNMSNLARIESKTHYSDWHNRESYTDPDQYSLRVFCKDMI